MKETRSRHIRVTPSEEAALKILRQHGLEGLEMVRGLARGLMVSAPAVSVDLWNLVEEKDPFPGVKEK